MMEDMNEVNDALGRNYGVSDDIDEADLDAELAGLEDELEGVGEEEGEACGRGEGGETDGREGGGDGDEITHLGVSQLPKPSLTYFSRSLPPSLLSPFLASSPLPHS